LVVKGGSVRDGTAIIGFDIVGLNLKSLCSVDDGKAEVLELNVGLPKRCQ